MCEAADVYFSYFRIARLTNYEYEVFGHMIKEEHDSLSDDEDEDSDYDATETVS